jgi:outer membrane cobalamin receptor
VIGRLKLSSLAHLAVGAEGYMDRLESATLGDREEHRSALLVEAAGGRLGALTGSAGLRRDWHDAHGGIWSPSASFAWWPIPTLRLRGSAGRAFRTPSWTERYYSDPANIGDPDLRPERSVSAELGASIRTHRGLHGSLTAFRRDARDLIDWARPVDEPAGPWRTSNVETARFDGLEAELGHGSVHGAQLSLRGSWLSVRSSAEAGFESKYALRPLLESYSARVSRRVGDHLSLSIASHLRRRAGETSNLVVDGRAAYDFGPHHLYLDLRNLGDTAYPDISGNPAAGREIRLGIRRF